MKKLILSIITVVCVATTALAQIPNNGFENWTSMGSYSNPDSWDQLNAMTTSMSVYTCTKGTPGSSGVSYIKLVSKNVSGMGVMPGVAVSGVIDMTTFLPKSGFAYGMRPQSLTGSWQYMASGSDAGFISSYLTKWNTGLNKRDTIAVAMQNLAGMAMSWASFTINFNYLSGATPDSAVIILSASGSVPVANSYLYVDNLAFTGSVAGVKENGNLISNFSVYPNPASEILFVEFNLQKNTSAKMQLIDISGKSIREINLIDVIGKINSAIALTGISKGIYFLKISSDKAVEVKKIIIE